MIEKPDSGHSTPEVQGPSFPFLRSAPVGREPETVINPERRPHLHSTELRGSSRSSVWNRLFPSDSEIMELSELPSPAGVALGHFLIEERIGVGGMGAVFRALDTRLQRIVALKVLSPVQSRDPSAVERFRNEARAAAQLDHDNIARVFYIGEDDGLHFIAFEFITGTNVRDLIRERRQLDVEDAVNYVLQIASALNHTSAVGVVHRDIKPSNIIITPSGRAKLVDLGLARKESTESAADLTLAGTTLGTFDYISPEQAKDPRNVDVRSDIYSLGCTLYHMLTGEPPYPEGTVLQKLLDHQGKEPPDPARKNRRVSDDLSAIIRKMMASDPRRRYATPELLIHDLMLVAGTLGLRGMNPEGLIWMSSKPARARFLERNLYWIAPAAALLLIVAALERFGGELQGVFNRPTALLDEPPDATNSSLATHVGPPHPPAEMKTDRRSGEPLVEPFRSPVGNGHADSADEPTGESLPDETHSPLSDMVVAESNSEAIIPPPPKPEGTANRFPPGYLFDDQELLFPGILTGSKPAAGSSANESDANSSKPNTGPPAGSNQIAATTPGAPSAPAPPSTTNSFRPEPEVDAPPITVLSDGGLPGKTFRTLEAACLEAESGSTIELRYDGVRREPAIRISGKKLTIRGALGYQPSIEFVPIEVPGDGFQTRLLSVDGGTLELNNVHIQLNVPDDFDEDRLTLFSFERPDQVRLQRVTISVNNPAGHQTTLVELMADPEQALSDMKMPQTTATQEPAKIHVGETFVRGDADFFYVRDIDPIEFRLKNTVVALQGRLISIVGSRENLADSAKIDLELDHVTCLTGDSLIRMDSEVPPRRTVPVYGELLPLYVSARNSLFAIKSSDPEGSTVALVSMGGYSDSVEFRQLLFWKGEKNFFDRFQTFWRIESNNDSMDFDRWKRHWDSSIVGANNSGIIWQNLPTDRDFGQLTLEHARLDRFAADNFAVSGATDGSDVGADLSKVPQLP